MVVEADRRALPREVDSVDVCGIERPQDGDLLLSTTGAPMPMSSPLGTPPRLFWITVRGTLNPYSASAFCWPARAEREPDQQTTAGEAQDGRPRTPGSGHWTLDVEHVPLLLGLVARRLRRRR